MGTDYDKLKRLAENYVYASQDSERAKIVEEEARQEFLDCLSESREAEQTLGKSGQAAHLLALAAGLREHNAWRRSEGKYAWREKDGEVTGPGAPNPHTPAELGALIDACADALEAAAGTADAKQPGDKTI